MPERDLDVHLAPAGGRRLVPGRPQPDELPPVVGGGAVEIGAVAGANLQRPAWSRDGSRLAFEANFHDDKRIELHVGEPREGGFAQVEAKARPTSSLTQGFQTSAGGRVARVSSASSMTR